MVIGIMEDLKVKNIITEEFNKIKIKILEIK